jgi:hypothetical protein
VLLTLVVPLALALALSLLGAGTVLTLLVVPLALRRAWLLELLGRLRLGRLLLGLRRRRQHPVVVAGAPRRLRRGRRRLLLRCEGRGLLGLERRGSGLLLRLVPLLLERRRRRGTLLERLRRPTLAAVSVRTVLLGGERLGGAVHP